MAERAKVVVIQPGAAGNPRMDAYRAYCRVCDRGKDVPTPTPLSDFVKALRRFEKAHKGCR